MNLEPFSLILQQASGLTLRPAGHPAITAFIEERMRALNLAQPEDYQQRLEQDAEERQRLVEAGALPETWFNRDPAAFDTLVKLAKDRLKKNPDKLRILCLPCSTGEEAYNIAAALTGAGLTPDQFVLEAVDISHAAIAAAQKAEYPAASFRKTSDEFREKYFTTAGEDVWQLTAEWKNLVNFRQGNMLQLETVFSGEPYDFIFNRNLLIYFARPDQAKALSHLRQLLKPDGIIFVAAGEGGIFLDNGFRTLRIPHAFAFRQAPPRPEPKPRPQPTEDKGEEAKSEQATAPEPAAPEKKTEAKNKPAPAENPTDKPEGEPAAPETEAPKRGGRGSRQRTPRSAAKQQDEAPKEPAAPRRAATPEDTVSIMEQIKKLADTGDMAEAESKLRGLLAGGSSDADAHFLMGLLQDAQGDSTKAMATYRRVMQLDGNHAEAIKNLAALLEIQGDKAEADRLLSRLNRPARNQPRRQPRSGGRGR
jgi:chemotaxis protein methyltransferase WspC